MWSFETFATSQSSDLETTSPREEIASTVQERPGECAEIEPAQVLNH